MIRRVTTYHVSTSRGLRALDRVAYVLLAVALLWSPPQASAQETEDPDTREVTILNVDRLEQIVEDGQIVRRLTGNVHLQQDSTYLQSDRAIQYLDQEEIFFFGNVIITDRGDSLRADTVFYNQQTKVGEARGRVEFFDGEVRVLAPSGMHHTDDKRTEFSEGVMLVDTLTTLTSWEGEYFSEEKRAEFVHEVRLHRPWSYLESDSITYYRDEEMSLARGDVLIERWDEVDEGTPPDSVSRTLLLGDRAFNDDRAGSSRIEGRSFVMQLRYDQDRAEIDTLIMRSDRLDAVERDDRNQITAVGNVRSWRQDFAAVADSVVYDRYEHRFGPLEEDEPPPLLADAGRPAPVPSDSAGEGLGSEASDTDRLALPDTLLGVEDTTSVEEEPPPDPIIAVGVLPPPDVAQAAQPDRREPWLLPRLGEILREYQVDLFLHDDIVAEEDTVEEVRLFRDPIAWFEQSQVTADSIRVRTDGTPVDSIFARGDVFIAQLDTVSARINQLKGPNLGGTSVNDSLRFFAISPNAQAIYHRNNEANEPDGATQASGDEVFFRFVGDDLEHIHFVGGIEGFFLEEEYMPESLQLDGFIWVPERRPVKDALLAEDPVQQERIVRLLTTYPPLPERVPDAPPAPGETQLLRPQMIPPPEPEDDPGEEPVLELPTLPLPDPNQE